MLPVRGAPVFLRLADVASLGLSGKGSDDSRHMCWMLVHVVTRGGMRTTGLVSTQVLPVRICRLPLPWIVPTPWEVSLPKTICVCLHYEEVVCVRYFG